MMEHARRELPALTRRVIELTAEVITLRQGILASPKRYPSMDADIQRLAPQDFLARTPHEQLRHVPRYLKAIQIRADRASISPQAQAKDAEKARPLAAVADWQKQVPPANREAFRWMLEEFRVSLFAQELGTAYPASAQRLQALLEG
jgi:ATP-dependent helicase HrpA